MRFAVIGAGINGLSVAINILENFTNSTVTIFAESVSPNTTGNIAAGLWRPYAVTVDDNRMKKWCETTYQYLSNIIVTDTKHHEHGLFYQGIYELSQEPLHMSLFHEVIDNSHFMNEKEMKRFPGFKYGIAGTSIIVETTKILAYLTKRFINLGGKMNIQKVENFDDVQMIEHFPVVINCTGLGSRKLCNDLEVFPGRGQVIRVKAPWIKFTVMTDHHYIIPQSDGVVVLGGTNQKDNWNTSADENDTKFILDGCKEILCGLDNPQILSIAVGLRPRRLKIRLEKEEKVNSLTGNKYTLIHNYGHGGSGFTLFYGCATDVVNLVREVQLHGRL